MHWLALLPQAACSTNTSTPSSGGVPGVGPNFATNTLYVVNTTQSAIDLFSPSPHPGASPEYLIGGGNTQMNGPQYDAFDGTKKLYVTNYNAGTQAASVTVYAEYATGDVLPIAVVTGSGLAQPHGIASLPGSSGFVVADTNPSGFFTSSIFIFGPPSGGSAGLFDVIAGSLTQLNYPSGVAVDPASRIFVTNRGNGSVTAYALPATPSPSPTTSPTPTPTPTGSPSPTPTPSSINVPPLLRIAGSNTGLVTPTGIALDSSNRIYVTDPDNGHGSVRIFAANATGNVAPIGVISGSATQLVNPLDVKLDSGGNIYVSDSGASGVSSSKVVIFGPNARGNVAPAVTIPLPFAVTGLALSP